MKHNASLSPISDLLRDSQEADRVLRNSPLFSLACYVGAFLIVLSALSVMAANVKPWTIPLIIAATYAFVVTLGAFQLRNDGKLVEKPFISLVEFSATRVLIPFLRRKVPGDKG